MGVKADRREAEKKPYSQTGAEMGIESEFIFCQKDGRWMRHQCHGFKELNKNRKVEHTGLEPVTSRTGRRFYSFNHALKSHLHHAQVLHRQIIRL